MSGNERHRTPPMAAYVEEADQEGNVREDAPRVAASIAPSSPRKEQPNTRKSRRSPSSPLALSESSASSEDLGVDIQPERSGESSSRSKDPAKAQKRVSYEHRPPARHRKTAPSSSSRRMSHHEEAAYYGRDPEPVITPAVSRPRARTSANPAHRHSSYHAGLASRPPLANAKYHHMHPSIMTALPPQSFPPPPWSLSPVAPPMHHPPPPAPLPPPPAQDFYPNSRSLSSRFERGSVDRPMSAMAHRSRHYADEYEQENRPLGITRRSSTKSKKREHEDRILMPPPAAPPPRPLSAMPLPIRSSPFGPPPPRRETPVYDDSNPFQSDAGPYADLSPVAYEYSMPPLVPRPRRPSISHSMSYDQAVYRTEVAAPSRRNSQYGSGATSSHVDKMRAAQEYQMRTDQEPQDPEPVPLTSEALRKASKSKHGGSSRSTRSTASRDESDYRQSATTRTSVEDDVTIRVRGNATLKLGGGAELQCRDGAEINFTRAGAGAGGSDRSSYIDPDERRIEDRRSRAERPPARTRASSQAGSYSRTSPGYSHYGGTDIYGTSPGYGFHPPPLPPPPLTGGPYSASPFSGREHRYSYFP